MEKTYSNSYQIQSLLLCMSMVLIYGLTTWLFGGMSLMIEMAFYLGFILLIVPYISPIAALKIHQAKLLNAPQAKVVYHLVENLSQRAELKVLPQVFYIRSPKLISFTVGGSKKSAIALSDGLLLRLNQRELNAVLAHEIAHIKNQDTRIMAAANMMNFMVITITILALTSLPFVILSQSMVVPLPLLILLPIASMTIFCLSMKLSRTRELAADHGAAYLNEDPEALIASLNKLEYQHWRWIEALFFIRQNNPVPLLLRSHPENAERIGKLADIAKIIQKPRSTFEISHFGLFAPKHLREIRNSAQ